MKRVFGIFEAIFDVFYLIAGLFMAYILFSSQKTLPAIMALVLILGDSFHLVPRILVILKGNEEKYRVALGRGKQITSITMTIFYVILWEIGKNLFLLQVVTRYPTAIFPLAIISIWVYILAVIRIVICLMPQNKWTERYPPVKFGIWRNVPFFLLGAMVAIFYFINRDIFIGLSSMWLLIVLSFLFYLPVVLWANKNPKIGMLMLPKTCAYLVIIMLFVLL